MKVRNELRLFCYFYVTCMLRGDADKVTNGAAEGVVFTSRMIRKSIVCESFRSAAHRGWRVESVENAGDMPF